MTMFKRTLIALAVAMAAITVPAVPSAQAQEIEVSGPLAGAPAVIGLRIYREMRFQIQLHSSMTLQDEFSRAVMGGGQLMFHPTDWLGLGVGAPPGERPEAPGSPREARAVQAARAAVAEGCAELVA